MVLLQLLILDGGQPARGVQGSTLVPHLKCQGFWFVRGRVYRALGKLVALDLVFETTYADSQTRLPVIFHHPRPWAREYLENHPL